VAWSLDSSTGSQILRNRGCYKCFDRRMQTESDKFLASRYFLTTLTSLSLMLGSLSIGSSGAGSFERCVLLLLERRFRASGMVSHKEVIVEGD
jgi:hypothetical protein